MKWSAEEENTLKKLKDVGFTYRTIAKKLGRKENSVKMKICKLGRTGKIRLRKTIIDDSFDFGDVDSNLLLKALMIWWCEGTSFRPDYHKNRVEIVNSDPRIVHIFVEFLRKIKVNEEKIRLRLKTPAGEEKELKLFWSNLLKLPMDSFRSSTRPVGTKRNNKPTYGTLTVRYNSQKLAHELYKRINLLSNYRLDERLGKT